MDYYFNNFKFNTQSLVLTQDHQPLAIRNNEAKLLAFFLASPEQVYSKEAILENVWTGKVVSEQAVFQAVSNLRALFGEEAVKTFPKKGYQWQIPLHADELSINEITGDSVLIAQPRKLPYGLWALALLGIFCLAVVIFYSFSLKSPQASPIPIVLAPFTLDEKQSQTTNIAQQLQEAFIAQVDKQQTLLIHELSSEDPPWRVAAAPDHFLEQHRPATGAGILVTGNIHQHEETLHLAFILQGRSSQWRGYISGNNIEELAEKLESLLNKVAPISVLWEASDLRLINAQLQILHSENPDDLAIHSRLIESFLYMGDWHSTQIQAEDLELQAREHGSVPYQALALLMQMYAGFETIPAEQQLKLLDEAIALAESIDDRLLQSYIMERYASIYYVLKNFPALEEKLLRALVLAEASPERRLQVLRTLSVFSFKFHHEDKRDEYLQRARSLLDEYQLPAGVYAQLDDLAGLYTNDNKQKEYFFRSAVERFKPEDEAWIKEMAQRHLIEVYLNEKRWLDALAVFANEKNISGAESFLLAQVYFKKNEIVQAQANAEAAFKKANLQGEYDVSLESALLLAQIYKQTNKPDLQKNMREFFEKNALESLKKQEQSLLDELR